MSLIKEAYLLAVNSGNLTCDSHHTSCDLLAASALAGSFGADLIKLRYGVGFERLAKRVLAEMVHRYSKDSEVSAKTEDEMAAAIMLYARPNCDSCHGTGLSLSDEDCQACSGGGRKSCDDPIVSHYAGVLRLEEARHCAKLSRKLGWQSED